MKKEFLVFVLFSIIVQGAWAQSVSYIKCSWDGSNVVTETVELADGEYATLNGDSEGQPELGPGFYVVKGTDIRYKRLYCKKDAEVSLVLCDGAKLTTWVSLYSGAKINIYAQSDGDNKGKLIAKGESAHSAIQVFGTNTYTCALNIHGGYISATGGDDGAGIGSDRFFSGGVINIYRGTVEAQGGARGAGIGSGEGDTHGVNGGTLNIYGGKIRAIGGKYGAGIGGGQDGNGAAVSIYGGDVYADGGLDAAGIGSGEETFAGPSINGGSLTVYGGKVFADGTDWGAGIGGGEDADGAQVKILGGIVEAYAGNSAGSKNGSAIGSEEGDDHRGSLKIGDDMMVHAGNTPQSTSIFPSGTRVPACYFRPYARIEACNHPSPSYTVTASEHTMNCPNCLARITSGHVFVDGKCRDCGFTQTYTDVNIYLPEAIDGSYTDGHYASTPRTEYVVTGSTITLPAPPVTQLPNGVTFAGWAEGTPTELGITSYWKADDETVIEAGTQYTVKTKVNLTARYTGVELVLADDAGNGETLYMNDGNVAHTVTLAGRTLHKDGSWNALCLPFDLSAEQMAANADFAGAELRTLSTSSYDDTTGELNVEFAPATSIEAGVPYFVKWTSGEDIVDPVFHGVKIKNVMNEITTTYVDLVGTYSPEAIYQENGRTKLFLSDDNTLCGATGEENEVKAFRAFFLLKGGLVDGGSLLGASDYSFVSSYSLDFNDDVVGITTITSSDAAAKAAWYTLDGCQLHGQPAARGFYIQNGRKVVIK